MRDHSTTAWSVGLGYTQWGINTTYPMGIKITPYEAVFGQEARVGLTTNIPAEFWENVTNGIYEEELLELAFYARGNGVLPTVEVGDTNILLAVPSFGRGRSNPANLVAAVIDKKYKKYRVTMKHGILNKLVPTFPEYVPF